ncbi:cyanoexosortase A [Nostoc sp. FACHB-87]|uniref:cyanoexosortase A n=1 Tax=Nostocaceae TaxID=1162 RepID=UPI001688DAD6|nr:MULTISPECIES: cyanoexosortase A [Nostocaceae]MBD2457832.1 cyanoexosortase A [Nostoc sp. FACHB-87]MBD2479058.1 cyanoexosortase A [Anabaena sp. FACHB-83]
MKATRIFPQPLTNPQLWLLGIGGGLVATLLTIIWKADDDSHLGMTVLALFAVFSLLGDKKHKLKLESDVISSVLGTVLIGIVLWYSTHFPPGKLFAVYTHIAPFVAALGLSLLASGYQGLKQYWQELVIIFFAGVPKVLIFALIDIKPLSILTAKFSTLMLWYAGFEVALQDVYINLPTGGIKVAENCAGIEWICHLLGLAVIGLLMFPPERKKRIFVPIVAVIIAFIVNAVRVAILAVMAANQNQNSFKFWHVGDGSLIFGMITVILFGIFYWFLLNQKAEKDKNITRAES